MKAKRKLLREKVSVSGSERGKGRWKQLNCIIHGYETVRQQKKTKMSRGFEQVAMVGPLPPVGSWEGTTLPSLAQASCAFANYSICAKLSLVYISAFFSRLWDPGEQVGLFREIKISLDLVPSLTPIRNYQAEYRTAVTYNLPPSHSADSHSVCQ